MKKVKKIPNCCSYNSPGFTYSQPFQTDAQMVLDLKLSYEHPPNAAGVLRAGTRSCRVLVFQLEAVEGRLALVQQAVFAGKADHGAGELAVGAVLV